MSSCCSGVGARGKNADKSVVNWVRLMTPAQASRKASHRAIAGEAAAASAGHGDGASLFDGHQRTVAVGLA